MSRDRERKLEEVVNDLLGLAGVDREDRDAGNEQREYAFHAAASLEALAELDKDSDPGQAAAWLLNAEALREEFGVED